MNDGSAAWSSYRATPEPHAIRLFCSTPPIASSSGRFYSVKRLVAASLTVTYSAVHLCFKYSKTARRSFLECIVVSFFADNYASKAFESNVFHSNYEVFKMLGNWQWVMERVLVQGCGDRIDLIPKPKPRKSPH